MDPFYYTFVVASIIVKVGLQLAVLILSDADRITNAKSIKILSQIAVGISGIALYHVLVSIRSPDPSFHPYLLAYIIVT